MREFQSIWGNRRASTYQSEELRITKLVLYTSPICSNIIELGAICKKHGVRSIESESTKEIKVMDTTKGNKKPNIRGRKL